MDPEPRRTRLRPGTVPAFPAGCLGRLARHPRHRRGSVLRRRADPAPGVAEFGRGPLVLRGVLECHVVAALSRRGRQTDLRTQLVGVLPHGERTLRERGSASGRRRRNGLDPGLPTATGTADVARTASRPPNRVLPAHSLSPRGTVHAVTVASGNRTRL